MIGRIGLFAPDGGQLVRGAPLGVVVGVAAYLFGGWDVLLQSLFLAVILDYCTGLTAAYMRKDLASIDMVRGIAKKLMYFAAVCLAVMVDRLLPSLAIAHVEVSLRTALIWSLLGAELLSVAENVIAAGVPLPKVLIERLKAVQAVQAGQGAGDEAGR